MKFNKLILTSIFLSMTFAGSVQAKEYFEGNYTSNVQSYRPEKITTSTLTMNLSHYISNKQNSTYQYKVTAQPAKKSIFGFSATGTKATFNTNTTKKTVNHSFTGLEKDTTYVINFSCNKSDGTRYYVSGYID